MEFQPSPAIADLAHFLPTTSCDATHVRLPPQANSITCALLLTHKGHAGVPDGISRVLYPFAGSTRQDGTRPDRWA